MAPLTAAVDVTGIENALEHGGDQGIRGLARGQRAPSSPSASAKPPTPDVPFTFGSLKRRSCLESEFVGESWEVVLAAGRHHCGHMIVHHCGYKVAGRNQPRAHMPDAHVRTDA